MFIEAIAAYLSAVFTSFGREFGVFFIVTVVNDILPIAQACIESDGGAFEYKLKSFKKRLNR